MSEPRHPWIHDGVERAIGSLLRMGVLLSAAVVLSGLTIYLASQGAQDSHYRIFRGEPAALRSVGAVVRGARTLDGPSLIQLGLLLLIATPVARVMFSAVAFALQRDRIYLAVTLAVLSVLLYSLGGGYH
jgi:uncharacterized membrane protein